MSQKKKTSNVPQSTMLDGMMTISKLDNNLTAIDFACCEEVRIEALTAKCKVQVMRDGNVYITELPKRVPNKPLFRDDNSSLSLGRDGRYYFYFSLPEEQVEQLPDELMRQAVAIGLKLRKCLVGRKEGK